MRVAVRLETAILGVSSTICRRAWLDADFSSRRHASASLHEKAHFVKADVAALEIVAERSSRAPALCFHPHSR